LRKGTPEPEKPQEEAANNKEVIVGLDDVRWYVGETLYLQQIDNPAIRYTVRLIGFVKNKTVFVTAPTVDGKLEFIRDGQTFVVRAFSGKKAYAFVSAAVKSVHTPHPYLHLSFPREVRCTVVRRGVRAQVKVIASVSLGNPERVGAAVLTDLSMGGTSGTIKQALGQKGDEGQIKFKVHAAGQDEFLNLKMVLRSVTPTENGDGYRHGFEFLDVSIHDRLILSAFVHQTLAEGE
jgi:c-di-GMP-binding flagellar brake protein YcgR